MKILLTGAGGQLGIDIVSAASRLDTIDLTAFTRAELDVTDAGAVQAAFAKVLPGVVIHGAAYTAVDDCESNSERAFRVNGEGTGNVVSAAREGGARVIYISTDYVFDGTKSEPYTEDDVPNPKSVYGASKLVGEEHVSGLGADGLIVRTSWVCGVHGANMVKTIIRAAQNYPQLTFVDDQIGKPTFTSDLAETLLTLAQRNEHGIMHVTNEGIVSWYEFCQEVLDAMGRERGQVVACSTEELSPPRPAPRPANSVLANTRFDAIGLEPLRDFREPLKETVGNLTAE